MKRKFKKHKILRRIFYTSLILGATAGIGGQIYIYNQIKTLPKITYNELHSDNSSNMYASNGTKIWSSSQNKRTYVKYKDIPESYKNLLISTEDRDFYKHQGFSYTGLFNAFASVIASKFGIGQERGGSTLEQQLIKLSVFSTSNKDRTINRKIKELFLAQQLYHNYSRKQILEFYVNKISMGENSYGAQTIANTYFGKKLNQLTISQQAIIAGLGQAPSTYNLYTNPEAVKNRRNTVLYSAYKNHKINKQQYQTALNSNIKNGLKKRYWDVDKTYIRSKKHSAFITSTLNQLRALGYDLNKSPLQIKTTLNIKEDNYINKILNNDNNFNGHHKLQAAMTITDPNTGYVTAQFGGRHQKSFAVYNRATQTIRSSGSGIKPILDYGPALEYYNWGTNHSIDSSNYTYKGTNVTATNFGNAHYGITNIQKALRLSMNTPAIRTLNSVGNLKAKSFINKLGITSNMHLSDSAALGLNVSTVQMATALSAFGTNGEYHKAQYIKYIKFSDNSVKHIKFKKVKAMRKSTAYVMTKILEGVPSKNGTLYDSDLRSKKIYAAAKTGTVGYPSNVSVPSGADMDIWTNAYTKSFALSMWMGYDSPMKAGNYLIEKNMNGARQNIYKKIMIYLAKGKDTSEWKKPKTVTHLNGSGLNANYEANDKHTKLNTSAIKTLDTVDIKTIKNYSMLGDSINNNATVKNDKSMKKVPSGYKNSSWASSLDSEKSEWYSKQSEDNDDEK